MEEILKIIGISETYQYSNFEIFFQIKRWTNFFKHPKSFVLTHHPMYLLENDPNFNNKTKGMVIFTQKDIDKYYMSNNEKVELGLHEKVANKKNVLVKIPNIEKFSNDFCKKCIDFIDLVLISPDYKLTLSNKSNLAIYYSQQGQIYTQYLKSKWQIHNFQKMQSALY